MRHLKSGRKLKRTASHRKALLSNLALALFISEVKRIRTTIAKAKEARVLIENLITKAKRASAEGEDNNIKVVHAKREIYKYIRNRKVIDGIFTEVLPKVKDRPGGYTRIVKMGQRLGDAAEMAVLELVDFNIAQDKDAAVKGEVAPDTESTKDQNSEKPAKKEKTAKSKKTVKTKRTSPEESEAAG